jgi:(p)ppGpp synthase/HD superfamily hydrolase
MDTKLITPYHGDIIDSARRLALAEHAKHHHGTLPYSYHLTAVAGLTACFTTDPEVIAAAWLHDIVEDCPDIDLEVVEQMTSARTSYIVDLLTDPPGLSRAEAKAIALPRIASDPDAVLIKLCDRFHNHASTIMDGSQKHARIYFSEIVNFIAVLGPPMHFPKSDPRWKFSLLYDMIETQHFDLARIANMRMDTK